MTRAAATLLAVALAGGATSACGPGASAGEGGSTVMGSELAAELAAVRRARILFMHHSVGRDVLAGMGALDAEAGGGALEVIAAEEIAGADGPFLAHFSGGRNRDPVGKIDAFAAAVRAEPRLDGALALMKLCYVDFEPGTDVEALFAHYRRTIEALQRERPRVRLAHVTVPLKRRPTDLRSVARRVLGRTVWEDAANVRRDEFSRRLAEAFPGAVLDLARAEAVGPDGAPTTFEHAGARYASLYPGYTEDGGHLNAQGRRAAGAAAIRFLAGAVRALPDPR
jgi:hypothetical protein